jgi:hypothetical protein
MGDPVERYVQFAASDRATVLVEVADGVGASAGGIQGAGPGQRVRETVVAAREAFEVAASNVLQHSSQAFIEAIRGLDPLPQEVKVTFGLKVSGELGVFTVAKMSSEATYSVTLSWNFGNSTTPQSR